jgi:hypothetical protein
MAKEFGRLSNTFLRLIKKDEYGNYTVYDFHTAINGNMWVQMHERVILNELNEKIGDCCHGPIKKIMSRVTGNKQYTNLKSRGYKFAGTFEQDIFGVERRKMS